MSPGLAIKIGLLGLGFLACLVAAGLLFEMGKPGGGFSAGRAVGTAILVVAFVGARWGLARLWPRKGS